MAFVLFRSLGKSSGKKGDSEESDVSDEDGDDQALAEDASSAEGEQTSLNGFPWLLKCPFLFPQLVLFVYLLSPCPLSLSFFCLSLYFSFPVPSSFSNFPKVVVVYTIGFFRQFSQTASFILFLFLLTRV